MAKTKLELPPRTSTDVINLSDTVEFQWLFDGAAFMIMLKGNTREDIDVYIDANIEVIQSWPDNTKFFSFQNISYNNVGMTPYFKKRLDEAADTMLEKKLVGHSMVLISDTLLGRSLKIVVGWFSRKAPVQQHWFTDYDQALETLTNLVNED